jgi:hypothetical protein
MLRYKYGVTGLALCLLMLSCSKKENYDIKGNPDVKIFTNNLAAGNDPINSIRYGVVNRPDGSSIVNLETTMPSEIKIPVYATRGVSQDITIEAELAEELIADYNATHGTSFQAFPSGMLNAANLMARINSGMSYSSDSLSVGVNLAMLSSLTGDAYMAPIRLRSVSNENVGSLSSKAESVISYIVTYPELRYIRYDAEESELVGNQIADRTAWDFSYSPTPAFANGTFWDGSNNSYIRWSSSPIEVNVNMQAETPVTGLRLRTGTNSNWTPTQIDLYISNDGINYQSLGTAARGNLVYTGGYTYVVLYNSMPAKYLRLMLSYSTSTSSNNRRLSELDVYTE